MLNKTCLLVILMACFLSFCTKKKVAPQPDHWFCSTLSDLPSNPLDTTGAAQPRAVAYRDKFWPVGYTFKVGLMGATTPEAALLKASFAKWAKYANLKFEFPATGPYDLRASFAPNDGAWSYIGIDCKSIPQEEATMNLGWYAADAYEHEIGHAIGLLHEHQNPTNPIRWNEAQVIKDLSGPPNNWTVDMIRFNVLNPYPLPNVITTAIDKASVMMYPIPISWTLDGFSAPGGGQISEVDAKFIGERYPFSVPPTTGTVCLTVGQVDSLVKSRDAVLKKFDQPTAELSKLNNLTRKLLGK